MSYIDCFDSEFVGYFAGICVYHPLETVTADEDNPENFACDPSNLVIGGGSGEYPAIVIKSPSLAARLFLLEWLEDRTVDVPLEIKQRLESLAQSEDPEEQLALNTHSRKYHKSDLNRIFDFAGWQTKDYLDFAARCQSPAMNRPFDPEVDGWLETWLAASVGEFILLAMPELVAEFVAGLGESLQLISARPIYRNLLLAAPGYTVWGRRETQGRVDWNISAWQTTRTRHPLTER